MTENRLPATNEPVNTLYRRTGMKRTRTRRTKAEIAQLERQIIDILRVDRPQSVRHVYYRLTDPRLSVHVEKTEAGYKQVQQRLATMRKAGRIPYGWISDSSRAGYHVREYDDTEQFIRSVSGLYRGRLWTPDTPHVEVWCESRSIAGVIHDTCQDLAVTMYPTAGFSSLTFTYEAAEYINSVGRPAVAVYIGDYDPAGMLIGDNVVAQLREHLEVPLEFRRVAVNREQVDQYDLPEKPRKPSEKRRPEIQATVEAEALPAGVLREIVREAVEGYLPAGQLEAVRVAEAAEREALEMFRWGL